MTLKPFQACPKNGGIEFNDFIHYQLINQFNIMSYHGSYNRFE